MLYSMVYVDYLNMSYLMNINQVIYLINKLNTFFQSKVVGGMNTLKDLILTRPEHRLRFLAILLESCSHEKPEV